MRSNQKGFSIVEVSIIILVVALIAFAGYYVYNRNQSNNNADDTVATQTVKEAKVAKVKNAPVIKSTADLDKAYVVLDQTNPDDSNTDVSALDAQLSGL